MDYYKDFFLYFRSQGCRKYPVMVKSEDDVVLSATKFVSERLCPIFQVLFYNFLKYKLYLKPIFSIRYPM